VEPWVLGKLLSPFAVVILALVVLLPARKAIQRRMAEGRLKRFLLSESAALRLGFFFLFCIGMDAYMRLVGAF
jgi:hypothetical protein